MRGAGEQARGYPSDLTDAQWQVIAVHLPAEVPGRRGRPRVWPLRAIIDAILYVDRAGCPWRYLPDSFPPWPTVYGYFASWRDDGTLARLHDALRAQVRAAADRDPQPTAAVIDSQSVRAADTVPKSTRGWDNAKKVNGRKRHIAVDSMGLLLAVVITAASVQDRDAARPLLWNLHRSCRRIRLIWADAVYTGKLTSWAASMKMTLQIVPRRNPHAFEVLPRRWVVERTFAWISKHRRTTRDYERLPASHEAMILWAMTALMACRLAQPTHLSNTHLACRLTCPAEPWAGSRILYLRVRRVAARECGLRVIMCVRQSTCDHHEGRDEQLARRRRPCRVHGRPVAVPAGIPGLPDRPGR
jgi:transposase